MGRHGERPAYNIAGEREILDTLGLRPAGCPVSGAGASAYEVKFRFGRLFEKSDPMLDALVELGMAMNVDAPGEPPPPPPSTPAPDDTDIPSGYTYLGQFIAHELTFDRTRLLAPLVGLPNDYRSPSLDLDSLYGLGPSDPHDSKFYDGDRFKIGAVNGGFKDIDFNNDLPREKKEPLDPKKSVRFEAAIGDERNDENLPLAQTHLAFMKFHNRVVGSLPHKIVNGKSRFGQAREKVIRHFQHIVLHDFLPRIVDAVVLKNVLDGDRRCKELSKVKSKDELFMPVEFSGAAFRLGHSMVRPTYDYNRFHRSDPKIKIMRPARLDDFFTFTQFAGNLDGASSLNSTWVIDWRRFYDSRMNDGGGNPVTFNKAKKIDTDFKLRLEKITGYPHNVSDDKFKAITVRNLVRGHMLGLPTGQAVAKALDETALTPDEIVKGANDGVRAALSEYDFHVRTPLWFYVLKEAELLGGGNRLGPVGSRVVAETLYCIIEHSDYSVITNPLREGEMLRGRDAGKFEMWDLLSCLGGDVDPSHEK